MLWFNVTVMRISDNTEHDENVKRREMIARIINVTPVKKRFIIVLLVILIPYVILSVVSFPDVTEETILQNKIAELQVKLENLQTKHISSQEDVNLLTHHLLSLSKSAQSLPNFQLLINNEDLNTTAVKLPSIYSFLPHFLNDPNSLRPAFLQSKGRIGVNMILGIPTVRRDVQNYLLATLKNLVECMDSNEASDTLIIVFVAEIDVDYVSYVAKQIEIQFPRESESGLIEIISPSPSYYPDFSKVRDTLGDSHQRVVWRSKQNLDFAFLMSYAHSKGTFYIQLEDDILAKKNFITIMKSYALQKISRKENWFILDFCQLGFIGKLFKCVDLPWLIQFFLMFYSDKPVDWLLDHLISTKICSLDKDSKNCKMAKAELWLHYKPSLFQHIGIHSSLKGKMQKLKDKQFGKSTLFYAHDNPRAVVESEIKVYKHYTLDKAYRGESFYWGLLPQAGDHLKFKFVHPIYIKKYLFKSGNVEHPLDKFYNTTVEILPEFQNFENYKNYTMTEDGYTLIGEFDSNGIAQGTLGYNLGKVREFRFTVHSESGNWAILSEIHILEDEQR
ncbi:alpha-1,3-mannosyl-glycoprotein 4-beta-N-acetylglucosaminyltransferase B isoform X3 [Microplitis demolitor]|uniref:alpha-1,3-mannosyl-glycoprotein 4-beta-N-acetylglucosaminyltransferase B isoform X3 n=1 Tax=Microplitis demolitor TaxID=69319 RepID=UPI00235B640A|nr:alpha-1,3-mannosyl-glycoprotein 4-beta-N-acetylglucosaminyltransferase B isoform X3 [Microplitis demolitor]